MKYEHLFEPIVIGKRCNVQDLAVIHNRCVIGDDVSVGHSAIVHGAAMKVYIAFLLIPQKVNFYNFTLGYDSCNILYKKLTKLQFIYINLMCPGVIF